MDNKGLPTSQVTNPGNHATDFQPILPKWVDRLEAQTCPEQLTNNDPQSQPRPQSQQKPLTAPGQQAGGSFYLQEDIFLNIQPVEETALAKSPYDVSLCHHPIWSELNALRQLESEHTQALKLIKQHYPPVAQYLEITEKRFAILEHALLTQSLSRKLSPNYFVALTDSSLSFDQTSAAFPDGFVHLQMVLFPKTIALCLFGKMSREKNTYNVHFMFHSNIERQLLNQHLHLKQSSSNETEH